MRHMIQKGTALMLCSAMVLGLGSISARAVENEKPLKDETVYVISSANGSQQKLIVNDWIQNTGKSETLQDISSLSDIENIKGEETFEKGRKGAVTWKANGNDIYYQGSSKEKVPVKVSISYQLDGKPIQPEKLAGKSGRVTIRFDYENTLHETVKIKGKKEKINVPFAAVTGMMLDTDHFRNVTVTNGKMENLGNEIAVLGIAFPGLQKSLDLKKEDFEIPDFVEISADTTDFELKGTVTVVSTAFLKDVNTKDLNVDKLTDATRKLTNGTNQLIDGSSKLSDGLGTLLEKSGALVSGIDQLMDGALKLKTGADTLSGGAAQLQSGASQLSQGLSNLNSNSGALRGGAQQVFNSLLSSANTQLAAAGLSVPGLSIGNYAEVLGGVINSLDENAVYEAALQEVTAGVNAKRGEIEAAVTEAVTQQVRAAVLAEVTSAVRETVTGAVQEQAPVFRAAVIQEIFHMTVEEYEAAVEAESIPQEQQDALNVAVEGAMTAEIEKQMQSEEIQEKISAVAAQTTDEKLASAEVAQLIADNTEQQVQKAISDTMASPEVQGKLQAAAEGAKAIISLKASLDSYNGFYLGVLAYTDGVSSATAGAKELNGGTATLKAGLDTLNTGVGSLTEGIQTLKEKSPALVDGVKQLKNGSVSLKDGLDKLMQDGIRKLANLAEDDLNTLAERLRACADLGSAYNTFSGISPDMDGTVKFIYKTETITVNK